MANRCCQSRHLLGIPSPLIHSWGYQNKAVVYDLLFRAAAETLLTIAADPKHLGARVGATAVLHSWGSAMTHHPHVHMIVPGGGISLDGSRWIPCRPGFLLPVRVLSRNHDGTIIPDTLDAMWGTDLTATITGEGQAAVFVAVDHCSAECVGIHAHARATRFQALEPIRQGVRQHFGGFAKAIARGLAVRHDHGSQYMSDHFQKELAFLGIESSPAFVRAPEGNGCDERFIRTLKENLLWVRTFNTIEELRQALLAFRETYNKTWLIERHGFLTPAQFRQKQLQTLAQAA